MAHRAAGSPDYEPAHRQHSRAAAYLLTTGGDTDRQTPTSQTPGEGTPETWRLPASGRSDERDELTFFDADVDLLKYDYVFSKCLLNRSKFDRRHTENLMNEYAQI